MHETTAFFGGHREGVRSERDNQASISCPIDPSCQTLPDDGDDEGFLSVAHREAPAVRRGGSAALVRRAKAEGGGRDVEGGVAFELVALWLDHGLDAKPDKVRDVASVDVGVSLPGGLLASGGAVTVSRLPPVSFYRYRGICRQPRSISGE